MDQDSEAQGQQLKTMEEIRELASASKNKEEGPKIPQSDYAKAFRQARQDTFDMQNSKDVDID
ncbi:hypothetical protein [Halocynthiibacter styelae]|uniref:Uncharacterized protein n=1 Tax=Halocynthiibacter styelae TaxID=2761955 RepID=A0A8J7IBW6_9RHOB|nr:hypothetical protein [Paenihalocynthiibacter styelae]MBI1492014.1 hypothetical protein [Paenihalocynthiibacter styelae]